ncbi:MAG: TRAP transporter small permease subunit [Candidatus Sedimenticola sp. 1PA]
MFSHKKEGDEMKRLLSIVLFLEDSLLVFLLSAMILLASSQILMRNAWDMGQFWIDPLLRLLVLWLGLLGAMAATRESRHISIDIVSLHLPRKLKVLVHLLTDLFASTTCALLAYHAARFVLMEKEDGATLFLSIPAWVCELVLPIGFGIMALRFLLHALLGRDAESEEGEPE